MSQEPEYLRHLPRYEWPNGARIAVIIQTPLEMSAHDPGETVEGHGTTIVPALPKDVVQAGHADLLAESIELYGAEVGLWRLLGLLDRHEVTGVCPIAGVAAEKYPELVKAYVSGGPVEREICCHGWGQDVRSYRLDREEFRGVVRKVADTVEKATGTRPVGWISPGASFIAQTVEVLAEEGFLYHGDYADSDSGAVVEIAGKKIVRMPVPWDVNDYFWYAANFSPPSAFVEAFRASFDVLYHEGGQTLGIVTHAMIFGRPLGVWALDQCIQYAKQFPNVWFATRQQVAECILAQG
jgi:peptidoglycan/xylan/chitin deacetylase (PgdA/CDA1 family)